MLLHLSHSWKAELKGLTRCKQLMEALVSMVTPCLHEKCSKHIDPPGGNCKVSQTNSIDFDRWYLFRHRQCCCSHIIALHRMKGYSYLRMKHEQHVFVVVEYHPIKVFPCHLINSIGQQYIEGCDSASKQQTHTCTSRVRAFPGSRRYSRRLYPAHFVLPSQSAYKYML